MKKLLLLLTGTLLLTQIVVAQVPILWGPASNDGGHSDGAIIKINGDGTGFTTVFSLNDTDGYFPAGTMVLAPNNMLYGMAFEGGTNGNGVIFNIDPTSGTYTDLYNIDTLGGAWVNSDMVQVNDTTLYGLIYEGGANNNGTIFSFNTNTNVFTKQYYFNVATGERPREIMLGGNNNLYGTTDTGGLYGHGTLFSYSPLTKLYSDLHDFDTSVGSANGSLVQTSDNTLYGTFDGATTAGGIYSYTPGTATYTNLFEFNGTNGAPSWDNGMTLCNGELYGMTTDGGTNGYGVVFRFNPSNNAYSDLVNFVDLSMGEYPICRLTLATDGNLYGMLVEGGLHNDGTIISFNPSDSTVKKLYDLTTDGGCSSYSGLTQVGIVSGINQLTVSNNEISVYPNPVSDELFLEFSPNFIPKQITIYNVIGQQFNMPYSTTGKSINVENLASGLYFIKATDDDNVLTESFIKE